jgi:hypothetical protein
MRFDKTDAKPQGRVFVIRKTYGATMVSALALVVGASPAFAADEAPAASDIVVTGLRASLRDAISAKRASSVVTETISAKDIGVLPDVTIADALARLPGVSATRDRGNASQASVRGLGPVWCWAWSTGAKWPRRNPTAMCAGKSILPKRFRASPFINRRVPI